MIFSHVSYRVELYLPSFHLPYSHSSIFAVRIFCMLCIGWTLFRGDGLLLDSRANLFLRFILGERWRIVYIHKSEGSLDLDI